MNNVKAFLSNKKTLYVFLIVYFIVNMVFLTKFPFVHSDEPWLSGLSRNMLEEESLSVTETFFDLYERHPHSIKSLFHLLQMLFLKLLGYNIFTFRFISLIFGTLTLFFFYRLSIILLGSRSLALVTVLLLSVDIQFIYASHFARQEVIILFILILSLYLFLKTKEYINYSKDIIIGVLIGISIGIHPNSFIISIPFGLIYLYDIIVTKKAKFKNLAVYVMIVAVFAAFFIALSISFDENFVNNYAKFGDQFGVLNPSSNKIGQALGFYQKLYYGVSGTYYTPNIKFQFLLFGITFILTIVKVFFMKNKLKTHKLMSTLLSVLGINIGIIIIGRYNQTSIVFIFPLIYILVVDFIKNFKTIYKQFAIGLIFIFLFIITMYNVLPYKYNSYSSYLNQIAKEVDKDDIVLANLNSEYYFDNGKLYDYRNLTFLKDNNLSFSQYIRRRNIEYIIYSEEMDFIYNTRPVWNGVYGNLYFYYDDMQEFLSNKCTLVHEFKDNFYGIRIARYIGKKDWYIRIYKVKE